MKENRISSILARVPPLSPGPENGDKCSPLVSVIIVHYNGKQVLNKCLESVFRQTYPAVEVIVVDNDSKDESVGTIQQLYSAVTVLRSQRNTGYAGGNNYGGSCARGEYIAILNNDAYPEPTWLSNVMRHFLKDSGIGVIGSKIYRYGTNILDSAGANIDFPIGLAPGRGSGRSVSYDKVEEVAYVGGAAMVAKKTVLEQAGWFDEDYFCYHEETDLCWRVRLIGYKVLYVPDAVVYHQVSSSFEKKQGLKEYLIERNRITTNLKNLQIENLLRSLIFESIYFAWKIAFSIQSRSVLPLLLYLKAWNAILCNLRRIVVKRTIVQFARTVPDRIVLSLHIRRSLGDYIKFWTGRSNGL